MIKSIIKEICIMLLLCIAIILILGVLFYDYIPSNKAVPNKLATYTTPQNVQTEINEQVTELKKVEVTYEITSSDLTLYKQSNSYKTGKVDPFSASAIGDTQNNNVNGTNQNNAGQNTTNTNTNSNNTNTNTNTSSTNTTTDPNSTGTFFNNTGLK